MSTKDREVGYFWTRVHKDMEWEVSFWNGRKWETRGRVELYSDNVFDEIDPNPIKREA